MEIEASKTKHRLETEKTTLGMHLHGQLEAKEVHAKRQTQLIEQLQTEIADKDDHSKSLAQLTAERMERERKRQEDLQKHTEDQKKLNREKLQEFKITNELGHAVYIQGSFSNMQFLLYADTPFLICVLDSNGL